MGRQGRVRVLWNCGDSLTICLRPTGCGRRVGNPAIVENRLRKIGAPPPHLLELAAHAECSGGLFLPSPYTRPRSLLEITLRIQWHGAGAPPSVTFASQDLCISESEFLGMIRLTSQAFFWIPASAGMTGCCAWISFVIPAQAGIHLEGEMDLRGA